MCSGCLSITFSVLRARLVAVPRFDDSEWIRGECDIDSVV